MKKYKHQTSKGQFSRFETECRNDLELLHRVYVNETGNNIALPKFQGFFRTFCIMNGELDLVKGVGRIKEYLTRELV